MIEKNIKNIYMIGICGTAMGSLAAMLKSRGYNVTGSDEHVYPPMSAFLEAQGIRLFQGFDKRHLSPRPDLVIIGNVMSRGNSEVEAVLDFKIPYTSSADALKRFFIQGNRSIVVSGTHGKTTISSLVAWILEFAGKDPSFMIGGIPKNFNRGFKLGESDLFVVEGDEYDTAYFDKAAKFFHYLPETVIVNNIEFDHADIYDNLDQIKLAFRRLVNLIPGNGLFLANIEDENVMQLCPAAFSEVQTFGLNQDAYWCADNINFYEARTSFDILKQGALFSNVSVPLSGYHNVSNVLAAVGAAHFYSTDEHQIRKGLPEFQNIVKRLELKASVNNISIYDDFAHHPSKVKATINGLSCQFPDRKIWAVFEPRTATSKQKIMEEKYSEAFDDADTTIIAPLYLPQKVNAEKRLSVDSLVKKINKRGNQAFYISSVPEIVDLLVDKTQPGDIILVMSNGSFNNIHQQLIDKLSDIR